MEPCERDIGRRRAFTLVELLVAMVVMSTALLGVHEMYRQAMKAEMAIRQRSTQRALAARVADHFAAVFRNAINVPSLQAVRAGATADGRRGLVLSTIAAEDSGLVSVVGRSIVLVRYVWGSGNDAGAAGVVDDAEKPGEFALRMQALPMNGAKPGFAVASPELLATDAIWSQVPATVIARGLSALSVEFEALDGRGEVKQDYTGAVGRVLVRIRVVVGAESVERLAFPRSVAADAGAASEGGE